MTKTRQKRIVIFHQERCMSCGSCELACSVSHTGCQDIVGAALSGEEPIRRRWMKGVGESRLSLGCQHCDPAPCVDACISAAMHKGPAAETLHDQQKCVGCWMCVMVCPFGAIQRLAGSKTIVKWNRPSQIICA